MNVRLRRTVERLFEPLPMGRGPPLPNRIALAPMTNQQSGDDGVLHDDELRWLEMRARGGFGLVTTCASHVAEHGKGFPGELGIFDDAHVPGLRRLATALRAAGAVSAVQLYHGGLRAIGAERLAPSDADGARGMTRDEVEAAIERFVGAAVRAETAGFDGVQIHAAHGYLVAQFLSPDCNRRTDRYGGSAENRARFLFELVERIRARVGRDFQLGVRVSPERFGQNTGEIRDVVTRLFAERRVEYVDLSLWDYAKRPEDPERRTRLLLGWFTDVPRGDARLGVAGRIVSADDALRALDAGADFVSLAKVAILHHDWPRRVRENAGFVPDGLPVTTARLRSEGLGERFVAYLSTWNGFVSGARVPAGTPRFDIAEYLAKGTSGK